MHTFLGAGYSDEQDKPSPLSCWDRWARSYNKWGKFQHQRIQGVGELIGGTFNGDPENQISHGGVSLQTGPII